MIDENVLKDIPSTFGVYIFKKRDEVLYVGKSVNLKARIKSHFENAKLNKKESLIINQSDKIETIITENEFKAIILEAELIKKYRPRYNVVWKDDKSYLYVKINIYDDYPKIFLARKHDLEKEKEKKKFIYFGPFSSSKVIQEILREIRHVVPFCSEKKISKIPCFYSKIGLCRPCPNFIENQTDNKLKIKLKKEYRKNIEKIVRIFKGEVTEILDHFYKELKKFAKKEKFEEAIVIRDKIFRLERLINYPISDDNYYFNKNNLKILLKHLQVYFSDLKNLKRIECFDVSNLGEKNQTASMVVMTNGMMDKKEYRRFKIKNNLNSDFERIKEVLQRRFSKNWPEPNLLVIDGGKPQVKIVVDFMKKIEKNIPVIGIAKNPDRIIIGKENFLTIKFPQTDLGFNLIRLLRDEAHRFAKKYHIFLREKNFLL